MSLIQADNDADRLWNIIEESTERRKFRSCEQTFLPKRTFEAITQENVIKQIISKDPISEDPTLTPQEKDRFVTKVHQDGPRLFVTCIYSCMPMSWLKRLLESRSDKDFPLTADQCPDWSTQDQRRRFMSCFLVNQKRFNAPFFELDSFQKLDDNYPMPIDFHEDGIYLLGKGAFGEVWKVRIHKDHHSFHGGDSDNDHFAMKIIQHEASMARERKFIHDTRNLKHNHLVKCFTSWKFGAKYYMIYELASCNLEEFIQKKNHSRENPTLTIAWLIKQMCGLAGALCVIHTLEEKKEENKEENKEGNKTPNDNLLGVPKLAKPARSRSGYIHDIKPENILVFLYEGPMHWFRLSDFSCAKVVDFIASISGQHMNSHLTTSKSGTPDYRPPESMKGETSRPYDLWSLGCVYLELLVWFLQGYPALQTFREDRAGPVRPGGAEDEAFYYTEEMGPNPKVQLRPAVVAKMSELKSCCPAGLRDILQVIPFLLDIDPKTRLDAVVLVQKLKHLDTNTPFELERQLGATLKVPNTSKLGFNHNDDSDSGDSDTNQYVIIHKPTDEGDK
ncbi:kinase-like protein [Melanomma pulvis-pyrius CBS 109.77]|uniref:Kinase-like protein n=1 Tax=Melanomma pulvis-pyrius CBS 109.77 TaxID=1314802 RepID=A0A6A6XNK4_9PLEO|nr:kinase-like protein [Melanomma pulvis-pyrius CBS 109.77]